MAVPEPIKKLVEQITFKWPDEYSQIEQYLEYMKEINFSANITTPAGEQLIVTTEDMGKPFILKIPYIYTAKKGKGCYFCGEDRDDDAKTRVYCYDRQPRTGSYYYARIYVNNFFKQSTSHLVIQLNVNTSFISVEARDVTPC